MGQKQVGMILVLLSVLLFVLFCELPGPEIERVTADDPSLAPGESTILHCDVYNPAGGELIYVWQADTGKIENLGDRARWTAPESVTSNLIVTITVTVSDEQGMMDEESIALEVKANP